MVVDTPPTSILPHCGPPPLRHRDRLDPPASSTNLNNHPEMIRLSPSRAAATWKHAPSSYISTITQATSGKGYLEDHRHVDTRSDLDRARSSCRPCRLVAIRPCQEGWS